MSSAHDITGQKILTERNKTILQSAIDGFWLIDTTGRILEVNDAYCQMIGYSRDELISMNVSDVDAVESSEDIKIHIKKLRNTNIDNFETKHKRKDGRLIYLEVSVNYLDTEDGRLFAFMRDISHRKRADLELQKKTHDIGERIKELNCLYEISKLIVNPDFSIKEVLQGVVDWIPPSWQYPDLTCAIITCNNKYYTTTNFKETKWSQSSDIIVSDKTIGKLEVHYLKKMPSIDEGPFLKEERDLIDGITRIIGKYLQRKQSEGDKQKALEASKKRQAEVSALLEGAQAVMRHRHFKTTARSIYDTCKNLIGATAGYIALLNEDGDNNELLFLDLGKIPCKVDPTLSMPIRGLRKEVYNHGKTVYENKFKNSKWQKFLPGGHGDLDNVLFAPLVLEGDVVGLLGLANKPGGFKREDARMAAAFGELVSIALYNSRSIELLENNEERFRRVTQSASDAIITVDMSGKVTFWNNAAREIFGYSHDEMVGKSPTVIIPKHLHKAHKESFSRVVSTGISQLKGKTVELFGIRKSGKQFPIELSLSTWEMKGKLFFTGIIRDISSRKKMEKELQKSHDELELRVKQRTEELYKINKILRSEIVERQQVEKALEREQQRLFSVLDQLPAYIYIKDSEYSVRFANRFFRNRFGDPEKKQCYEILHKRSKPCEICPTSRVFRTKHPEIWTRTLKDGRFYQVYDYPFTDIDGSPLVMQLGIDITEQKQAEETLVQSEKLIAIGQMSAMVSHEFRNALTSLRMILELQNESSNLNSSEKKSLSVALNSVDHMENIVTQMLSFARPTQMELKKCDLNEIIEDSLALLHLQINKTQIKIEKSLAADIPRLRLDSQYIKETFVNILLNSLQALNNNKFPGDAKTISIVTKNIILKKPLSDPGIFDILDNKSYKKSTTKELVLSKGTECAQIQIMDTGPGIDPGKLKKIFDPFFTTKISGTGLGLSLVKRVINFHGGIIQIKSKLQKETVVTIFLPLPK